MGIDPTVIAAIAAALEADPTNVALRLHLAQLLHDDQQFGVALAHCRAVLAQQPAHLDALRIAAGAAWAVGEADAANGYASVLAALQGNSSSPASPAPAPPPRPEAGGARYADDSLTDEVAAAEVDAFLSNTFSDLVDVEAPSIRLADVGGLSNVKDQLHRSFIGPMQNPELRKMYGKSLRGGLLMYGPPGCGKTFLARAVAGEMGANFFSIGLHEVLDMWIGSSERNVHDVFQTARRNAPCVLFLDELDALGQSRSRLANHGAMRNVVVQLLTELDGVGNDNEGVFVLAATNQPWDLDPALRRPGRLDRVIFVAPPDREARATILRYHLAGRPADGIDVDAIAKRTDHYSGADLHYLCETAAEYALDDSLRSGQARPMTNRDMERALAATRASTEAWCAIAKNFATFANESGEYDELVSYLRGRRIL